MIFDTSRYFTADNTIKLRHYLIIADDTFRAIAIALISATPPRYAALAPLLSR